MAFGGIRNYSFEKVVQLVALSLISQGESRRGSRVQVSRGEMLRLLVEPALACIAWKTCRHLGPLPSGQAEPARIVRVGLTGSFAVPFESVENRSTDGTGV